MRTNDGLAGLVRLAFLLLTLTVTSTAPAALNNGGPIAPPTGMAAPDYGRFTITGSVYAHSENSIGQPTDDNKPDGTPQYNYDGSRKQKIDPRSEEQNGRPVAGRTVYGVMTRTCWGSATSIGTATTQANGTFTFSNVSLPAPQSGCNTTITLTSPGSETISATVQNPASGKMYLANIYQAPHLISPNGSAWLRKFGNGRYPMVIVEGYDTNDARKTGDILALLGASTLPGGGGSFLQYLMDPAHDYSLYIITAGANWDKSLMGSASDVCYFPAPGKLVRGALPAGNYPLANCNGLAYQTMKLAVQARNLWHGKQKLVIGGYSEGGLTVMAGLKHWCNGDFGLQRAELDLRRGCVDVSLWWAGDAPLAGAHVPLALQEILRTPALANLPSDDLNKYAPLISADAAREMLIDYIDAPCAATNACFDQNRYWNSPESSIPVSGCDLSTVECARDNSRRASFVNWAGSGVNARPRRLDGSAVPSIAFGVGKLPSENRGLLEECDTPNGIPPIVKAYFGGSGTLVGTPIVVGGATFQINLRPMEAFGECAAGSRLTPLYDLPVSTSTSGSSYWGFVSTSGYMNVQVPYAPSFIPTTSSLLYVPGPNGVDWTWSDPDWKDIWYNNENAQHAATTLPSGALGFLMAWTSAYLKGDPARIANGSQVPACSMVKPTGARSGCEMNTEITNGIDDDGDDVVDEVSCGNWYCDAGETPANCPFDCMCGDQVCSGSENINNCAIDCTAAPDFVCTSVERPSYAPECLAESGGWELCRAYGAPDPYLAANNPCIGAITSRLPKCANWWDADCVRAVEPYCGSLSCTASWDVIGFNVTEAHPNHEPYTDALFWSPSGASVYPSPITHDVCIADPYCCATEWDSRCAWEATCHPKFMNASSYGSIYSGNLPSTCPGLPWGAWDATAGSGGPAVWVENVGFRSVLSSRAPTKGWFVGVPLGYWSGVGNGGNGYCEPNENPVNWPGECSCGDGICSSVNESRYLCPQDCGIHVVRASYGENCSGWSNPRPRGNKTAALAGSCDGKQTCLYYIDVGVLGDPAQWCAKTFSVEYSCGSPSSYLNPKVASVAAEAAGQYVFLSCP